MNPEEKTYQILVHLLENKFKREQEEIKTQKYQKVKDLLLYLSLLGTCIFAPNAIQIFKPLLKKRESEFSSYFSFNPRYLKRKIKRLHEQQDISIDRNGEKDIIKITNKGRNRIIKYAIENIEINIPKVWDKKWRLVIYDIPNQKKKLNDLIRVKLVELGFFAFQKSVFIIPYPCYEQVKLLRTYFDLTSEVHYMTISWLEDEEEFKKYFNLS